MICDAGDVVVVPFPFLERPVSKRRPALVLSASKFNEANLHAIFAMITTGAHSSWPSDCKIGDLASAGLGHASVVRMKLFTLPNDFILKRMGALAESDKERMSSILADAIGLR